MARLPRLYAPSVVQHVVQRPIDGRRLFEGPDDCAVFVEILGDAVRANGVALHAWTLTPLEFRFLGTPSSAEAIGRAMQAIGRRYVPLVNKRNGRAGSLWQPRYRSTLIDADTYLLASMRHVEERPVVLGFVDDVGAWPWSSHAHHIGRARQSWVTDHRLYWALSDTPFERQAAYRAFVEAPAPVALRERVDQAVERGWFLGDAAFVATFEADLSRRAHPRAAGRPRKLDGPTPIIEGP